MTYPAYEKYKESGVPWLGQVPEGWSIKKLRYAAKLSDRRVPYESVERPYMGLEHIESWTGKRIQDDEAQAEGIVSLFDAGDVLFGKLRPYLAKVHLAEESGCVSTEALVLRQTNELHTHFLQYYMLSPAFIDEVNATTYGAKMPRANWSDVGSLPVSLPSLPEQKAIAGFLDAKTAEIDALIAKKQKLLKLLAEQRTALITHAVTKGLYALPARHTGERRYPDQTEALDSDLRRNDGEASAGNVHYKDSGIDWLGHIPAHWEVKRLRFAITTNPQKSKITAAPETLVSFVPMDAVGEYGGLRLDAEKPMEEIGDGYTYFAENDVVVAKITPCFENGKGAFAKGLTNGIAFGTTELHVLRASNQIVPEYLFLLTTTYPFRKIGESEMYGAGGQKRVPERFIKDLMVGLPPLEEQQQILDYVDGKLKHMDAVVDKTQQAIDHLKEYRTALITNAVTGKIDVRGYVNRHTGERRYPDQTEALDSDLRRNDENNHARASS